MNELRVGQLYGWHDTGALYLITGMTRSELTYFLTRGSRGGFGQIDHAFWRSLIEEGKLIFVAEGDCAEVRG